ncbi:MAG: chromate transporter, partial [Bacilli bacterium]
LIASAGVSIMTLAFWENGVENTDFVSVAIAGIAFFVLRKFKTSPIIVMISTGLIGIIIHLL